MYYYVFIFESFFGFNFILKLNKIEMLLHSLIQFNIINQNADTKVHD